MPERFSASSAAKHMSCPASANLDLAIPNWTPPVRDDTVGAKAKGTSLHKIFADISAYSARDIRNMAHVLEYVAEVRSRRLFKVLIEETVQATWLQRGPNTTADLVLYVQDEIHVFDLKTGEIEVEVCENHQLLFYAVSYAPLAPRARGVHLHILQPWASKTGVPAGTEWFADTLRLKQFMDDAQETERKILAGDTTFQPTDHCIWCPAYPQSRGDKGKPLCPAAMQLLYPRYVDEDAILAL